MDFDFSMGNIFSSLVIGGIGYVCFRYGKATSKFYPLVAGILMFVYPYFVSSILLMWLIEAGLLAGLYFTRER